MLPRHWGQEWFAEVSWLGCQAFCMGRREADIWLEVWAWGREHGGQREVMRAKGYTV